MTPQKRITKHVIKTAIMEDAFIGGIIKVYCNEKSSIQKKSYQWCQWINIKIVKYYCRLEGHYNVLFYILMLLDGDDDTETLPIEHGS
ncbi:unnamed protein product [Absidia cylindrospora]